jgi:hypothetical protein
MGLDMYLKAETYVGGWNHGKHATYDELCRITGITPCDGSPSFSVSATVGYWRKANAIHRWFVNHVQGGEDDCRNANVSREQLGDLRDACNQVLNSVETVPGDVGEGTTFHHDGRVDHHSRGGLVVANAAVAEGVLPTQSGFFFGKTGYDEDYLADLRDTVAIVDRVLGDLALKDCEFTYQSSW